MTLNFPTSPSVNDTYTYNGTTFVWDGEKWDASTPFLVNTANIVDDAVTGDKLADDIDIVTTGDVQTASLNGGPLAGFRNQIINPNFTVQQRGASFTAPADVYTFDRWWMGNAAGRNVGISSDGPYQNALLITSNTADNVFLRQGIEIQQGKCGPFVQNSVWTLSLWSDTPAWDGRFLGVCAFRDAGKMNNSVGQAGVGSAGAFAATGESASGMSRYALQIDIGTAQPAATHGMLCIGLSLPTGGHRISAVQLEPGPVATPFEHRPIGTELALSQRYYYQTGGPIYGSGNASQAFGVIHPVTMRAVPTMSVIQVTGVTPTFSDVGTTNVSILIGAGGTYYSATYSADAEL